MLKNVFISTNQLKVLSFFSLHTDESFHEREVARKIGISAGGTNDALNNLYDENLLSREKRGKTLTYTLNEQIPAIKFFKILNILILLNPIIEDLKKITKKIIIYGSYSRGESVKGSDVDLLIVSNKREEIQKILERYSRMKNYIKIQPAIRSSIEWISQEKNNPTFLKEVLKGIILWDKQRDGK